jgi:hypothetical protein
MKTLIAMMIGMVLLTGCTANDMAKNWGGKMNFDLPKGNKLVTITWKDADMWYLMRPMRSNEVAETYEFCEKSSFGMVQGKIIIKESN